MRIVLLGSNGMLGNAIKEEIDCECYGHQALDITDSDKVDELLHTNPDVIINCAAYTDVPGCELNYKPVLNTNIIAPTYISNKCKNTKFIHFSTDYVFDGEKEIYTEEDTPFPINRYGWGKYLSELGVLMNPNSLVIRISWLFGPKGNSFISKILCNFSRGQREFCVVDDQKGKVTYTKDIAKNITKMFDLSGIYHFANEGELTWYDLAREVFRIKNPLATIIPISTPTGVICKRPKNSVLDTTKIKKEGIHPIDHLSALNDFLK